LFPTYGLIDVASAILAALWSLLVFLWVLGLAVVGMRLWRCF